MNRCPITNELCANLKYSKKGLQLLSRNLQELKDFPYTPKEQIERAAQLASKLSIQGVQPKLSVKLNVAKAVFEIVEQGGTFIFKPPHQFYSELPQNEDVTMRMAAMVMKVPLHGMVYNIDGSFTYFIKRFDRISQGHKIAVEDFSQLLGFTRDTKYESSMEKIIAVLEKHTTFPLLEKIKLFRLTLFNFLVGNEDMHLKNFSLIRNEHRVQLSPAYDLINTSIAINAKEEIALPLRGKKSRLTATDFFDYYGKERLGLSEAIIEKQLNDFVTTLPHWKELVKNSFLSPEKQLAYLQLLEEREKRLFP